jgi:hypothetical protein
MPDTRCSVCGRGLTPESSASHDNDTYKLSFDESVCGLCAVTLDRAMSGLVDLLRQSHGERRERVIDRLTQRLKANGFEVGDAFARRRTA